MCAIAMLRPLVASLCIVAIGSAQGAYQIAVPLVVSASDPSNDGRQGFVRITNHSAQTDSVEITAIDDRGKRFGPISTSLLPWQTMHFNSDDLEDGNPDKGIPVGVGSGEGDWRLELDVENDDLYLEVLAYVRTRDGFLTSIHELVPGKTRHRVATFNPASNTNQISRLRLINPTKTVANIAIVGVDDRGSRSPEVTTALPAGAAYSLSAQHLEYGHELLSGTLSDGTGKWQLFVTSDQRIQVMSLMETTSGHLTNLSAPSSPEEYDPPPE